MRETLGREGLSHRWSYGRDDDEANASTLCVPPKRCRLDQAEVVGEVWPKGGSSFQLGQGPSRKVIDCTFQPLARHCLTTCDAMKPFAPVMQTVCSAILAFSPDSIYQA